MGFSIHALEKHKFEGLARADLNKCDEKTRGEWLQNEDTQCLWNGVSSAEQ